MVVEEDVAGRRGVFVVGRAVGVGRAVVGRAVGVGRAVVGRGATTGDAVVGRRGVLLLDFFFFVVEVERLVGAFFFAGCFPERFERDDLRASKGLASAVCSWTSTDAGNARARANNIVEIRVVYISIIFSPGE
ncbi:hypothetical protein [Bradymonas sediminis]|uniref:Uncharacterized protein n=1 Tax=Bradymonas sediminis TaxID=1548548 RepID=A0A2Z4FQ82_9DELT|nr:hypothetical protein [Bradymonas sediminis]AWV90935.1 hypothetical protein DN745_17030 [Bradymonas sediminis]